MKGNTAIMVHTKQKPKVLLLGNGLLRMAQGTSWDALLQSMCVYDVDEKVLDQIPYHMRPEALFGTNIEQIRHQTAVSMEKAGCAVSPQLKRLLDMDFDCVLTTNYTYEAEEMLLGKPFTPALRQKAIRTFGSPKQQTNMQICYEIERPGKPPVQVWHIHGDAMRHNSLVLSYHSYVKVLASLWQYNRELADAYYEHQQSETALPIHSWLEWLLAGDLYSVGFGWSFAELDLWWALERRAREHGKTGNMHVFFFTTDNTAAKGEMLKRFGAQVHLCSNQHYGPADYDGMIDRVGAMMQAEAAPLPEGGDAL